MGKGQDLYKKAKTLIPGGTMLLSKRPEMFLPENWPAYFSKAKGCKIWDLENNELVDMSIMGIGTNTLGYSHDEVDNAVLETVKKGNMSTLSCPEEVYLAEKLIEINPWADMVKFARSGGEANSIAIRIARAASSKKNIAFCGYHGWHDWYLATNIVNKNSLNSHLLDGIKTTGVPENLRGTVFPFKYNDLQELIKIVQRQNIGVIIMEVRRYIEPNNNFLGKIRNLCNKKKIVLIFDECTSGFRQTFGGLHKLYGVNPDIAMYGKALGNGYAINAVVGTRDVMEYANKSFISSTFWGERAGFAAALKTLQIMNEIKSWKIITKYGEDIICNWKKIAAENSLKLNINGIPALASFSFEKNNLLYKTLIAQEFLKKNMLASNIIYVSIFHSKKNMRKYYDILYKVFSIIKKCQDGENFKEYLDTNISKEVFERLN